MITAKEVVQRPSQQPSCRQAGALNSSVAAGVRTAQSELHRKRGRDAAAAEDQLHARFLLDLADGTLTGILVMMGTATYCALTTGFSHLQLGR